MNKQAMSTERQAAEDRARYLAQSRGGEMDDYLPEKFKRRGNGEWRYQSGELRFGEVVDEYIYKNERRENYLRVERTSDKQFPQSHWADGKWKWGKPKGPKIPYRLPELIKAETDQPVVICEGEKDADNVAALGLVATCASEGAGKWTPDLNNWFVGKIVYVLQDNDEAGRRHAQQVVRNLRTIVGDIRIVALPGLDEHGDVSDWLAAGGTREKLLELCSAAPNPTPDFIKDPHGAILKNHPQNTRTALSRLGVIVRLNEFSAESEVTGLDGYGPELTDAGAIRLHFLIGETFGFLPTQNIFERVLIDIADQAKYHPVRDYLDFLVWDGVPRVDTWLTQYGGANDTPLNRAIGHIWLIAGVRRVRRPGVKFDTMPVFESRQGLNKSTGLRKLAIRDEWFTDNLMLSADSKEVIEQTRGIWIAEFADLSGIRGRDIDHVKSFLSRQDDRARPAYGRRSERVPRQFITAGTTNDNAYLLDNENRRFWPARIEKFKIDELTRDAPQLWAEAAHYEARGEAITLDENLWADAAVEQNARRVENPFTSMISMVLGDGDGWIETWRVWELLDIPLDRRSACSLPFGKAMRDLGFERIRNKKRGAERDGYLYQRGALDKCLWSPPDATTSDAKPMVAGPSARQLAAIKMWVGPGPLPGAPEELGPGPH